MCVSPDSLLSPEQLAEAEESPCPTTVARQHLQAARTFLPTSQRWLEGGAHVESLAALWARRSMLGIARYVTGSRYFGNLDACLHSPSGLGAYRFTDGTYFIGRLRDGMFEGRGVLCFPTGSKLRGRWEGGELSYRTARYFFNDDLEFSTSDWDYCQAGDRRYQRERVNGLAPAGRTLLVARPELPEPEDSYLATNRRMCRGATTRLALPPEPRFVGFRPELYEGWHWARLYQDVPAERLRHLRVPYGPADPELGRRYERLRRHEGAARAAVEDAGCGHQREEGWQWTGRCLLCAMENLLEDVFDATEREVRSVAVSVEQ